MKDLRAECAVRVFGMRYSMIKVIFTRGFNVANGFK